MSDKKRGGRPESGKSENAGRAIVAFGLGYGDETKGATVDWLTARLSASLVVRYGGGPQAAHHVQLPDGRWHCFCQFGSGILAGADTALAPAMLLDLEMLEEEGRHLFNLGVADPFSRLTLDSRASLVTPLNILINQISEMARGDRARGSCGQGVGNAFRDKQSGLSITLADVIDGQACREKLERQFRVKAVQAISKYHDCGADRELQDDMIERIERLLLRGNADQLTDIYRRIVESCNLRIGDGLPRNELDARLRCGQTVIFEPSQGALLDRMRGFNPHVTKPPILAENAYRLLPTHGPRPIRLGITRAFMTRHGNGPMVTERPRLTVRMKEHILQENVWQGSMRFGWLDLPALRYGLAINGGADLLAVSCLDQLAEAACGYPVNVCQSYAYRGDPGLLADLFDYERLGEIGRYEIHGFRHVPNRIPEHGRLTQVLNACRPFRLKSFSDLDCRLEACRSANDLPDSWHRYLEFIAGPEGLDCPVGLIAVGPSRDCRISLPPLEDLL